jgi:hypothetical protein
MDYFFWMITFLLLTAFMLIPLVIVAGVFTMIVDAIKKLMK